MLDIILKDIHKKRKSELEIDVKMFIAFALWKIPGVRHKWCWASAVMWAFYGNGIRKPDPECYYCMGCKTDEHVKAYFGEE